MLIALLIDCTSILGPLALDSVPRISYRLDGRKVNRMGQGSSKGVRLSEYIPPDKDSLSLEDLVAQLDYAKVEADHHQEICREMLNDPEIAFIFKEVPEEIEDTADALDKMHFDVNVTNVASLSTSIVGGAIFGAGAVGTFFTFGLSAPMMIAGGLMCGAGVVTGGTANTIEWRVSAKRARRAQRLIRPWNGLAMEYNNWQKALDHGKLVADAILFRLEGHSWKVDELMKLRPLDPKEVQASAIVKEKDEPTKSDDFGTEINLMSPENEEYCLQLDSTHVFIIDEDDNLEVHDMEKLLQDPKKSSRSTENVEAQVDPATSEVVPEKMLKFQVVRGIQSGIGVAAATREMLLAAEAADASLRFASTLLVPLTVVFIGTDMHFLARTAKDLKNGSRTDAAASLRETAANIREINSPSMVLDRMTRIHANSFAYLTAVMEFSKSYIIARIENEED